MEEQKKVKTMEERREEFVKWRFTEKQVFNNGSIEIELANPDILLFSGSDLMRVLNNQSFVAHLFVEGQKKVFAKFMPELSREKMLRNDLCNDLAMKAALVSLYESHMVFPCGADNLNMYIALDNRIYSGHVGNDHELQFLPSSNIDALENILKYSLQRDIHIIEKLLVPLRECVALERIKAEIDFNNAIAVSEDGKEIVCADKVFVHFGSEQENGDFTSSAVLSFPPEAFQKDKIILSNKRQTITNESTTRGVFGMLADNDQVLEKRGSVKWLHARHDRCPKILPAGGEYVDFP